MDPVFQFLSADLKQKIFIALISEDFSKFRNYAWKSRQTRVRARIQEIINVETQSWLNSLFESNHRPELLFLLDNSIDTEFFFRYDIEQQDIPKDF
jgi:hypothetical protein